MTRSHAERPEQESRAIEVIGVTEVSGVSVNQGTALALASDFVDYSDPYSVRSEGLPPAPPERRGETEPPGHRSDVSADILIRGMSGEAMVCL